MFWSSPTADMEITLWLLGAVFIAAAIFGLARRSVWAFVAAFSVLANGVFLLDVVSRSSMFAFYHILWLKYFSLFIWPIVNIIFLIFLIIFRYHKK